MINWKQRYIREKQEEQVILKLCPDVDQSNGIYCFYREENGMRYAYIGKAEKQGLLKRIVQHRFGYQHIDNSIRKHKFYSETNISGYKVCILKKCEPGECNYWEQFYIKDFANRGYQLRNVESGGNLGKTDIGERAESRGYRDGIAQGELNTKKEIKVYFDKYLDFVIKGELNKIKERKLQEFKEWLEK